MFTTLVYEEQRADLSTPDEYLIVTYSFCQPPARLKSKGAVLLLHGCLQTKYAFRHVVDLFAMAGYITIIPDFLGISGASSWRTPLHPSRTQLSHILARFITHLGLPMPLHFVGHGLGAEIAVHFAFRYPEMLSSITLSEALPLANNIPQPLQNTTDNLNQLPRTDLYEHLETFIHHNSHEISAFLKDDILEYVEYYSDINALQMLFKLLESTQADAKILRQMLALKGSCKHPCLLLMGEHSDINTEAQKQMHELFIKQGKYNKLVVVENSKGFPAEEQPESYALRILAFINNLNKFALSPEGAGQSRSGEDSIAPKL